MPLQKQQKSEAQRRSGRKRKRQQQQRFLRSMCALYLLDQIPKLTFIRCLRSFHYLDIHLRRMCRNQCSMCIYNSTKKLREKEKEKTGVELVEVSAALRARGRGIASQWNEREIAIYEMSS